MLRLFFDFSSFFLTQRKRTKGIPKGGIKNVKDQISYFREGRNFQK